MARKAVAVNGICALRMFELVFFALFEPPQHHRHSATVGLTDEELAQIDGINQVEMLARPRSPNPPS